MRKRSEPWERWSASKIDLLLFKCPKAFSFRYVLFIIVPIGIEKIFGGDIHRMAQKFFTLKNGYKSEKSFIGAWRHWWWKESLEKKHKNMVKVRNPDDPEKFFAIGVNILKRFYQDNLPYRNWELPIPGVEKRFSRKFKGHRITGVKDRIQPVGSGYVEIWDYKTGLRKPAEKELKRDIQFTFYNLDHYLEHGQNPIGMRVDHLSSGEQISVPIRTEKDYEQLGRWLDEATIYVKNILQPSPGKRWKDLPFLWLNPEDIERQYFSPKPGNLCNYCDYEDICQQWHPQDSMRELWVKRELEKIGPDPGHIQFDLPFPKRKTKSPR